MSIYNEVACRGFLASVINGSTNRGPTAGIWSGTGGTIVVVLAGDLDGVQSTFTNVQAGQWLPISIKQWVSGPADALGVAI